MSLQDESTVAIAPSRTWPQVRLGGWLGYALIWAFFALFLIYPLIRLFYDTFTTDQGNFTLMNFYGFFTDSFYLKCLVNSLLLGAATVVTTSILGIAIAFLLMRYDFPGGAFFLT